MLEAGSDVYVLHQVSVSEASTECFTARMMMVVMMLMMAIAMAMLNMTESESKCAAAVPDTHSSRSKPGQASVIIYGAAQQKSGKWAFPADERSASQQLLFLGKNKKKNSVDAASQQKLDRLVSERHRSAVQLRRHLSLEPLKSKIEWVWNRAL